jgi:hypothetical protein
MKEAEIRIYEDQIAEDQWCRGTTPDEVERLLSLNVGKRFRLEIIGSKEGEEE